MKQIYQLLYADEQWIPSTYTNPWDANHDKPDKPTSPGRTYTNPWNANHDKPHKRTCPGISRQPWLVGRSDKRNVLCELLMGGVWSDEVGRTKLVGPSRTMLYQIPWTGRYIYWYIQCNCTPRFQSQKKLGVTFASPSDICYSILNTKYIYIYCIYIYIYSIKTIPYMIY